MKTTARTWIRHLCAILCGIGALTVASSAAADATGTYDGSFDVKKTGEIAIATASLTQDGKKVTGRVTIQFIDAAASGTYTVTGKATTKKVKLKGVNAAGAKFKWKGKWVSDTAATGKGKIKGAAKAKGRFALNRLASGSGAACNSTYFNAQIMGQVLVPVCANCHVPGGVAQTSNFRVSVDDPLATQLSVFRNVDVANPAASPILMKPTNLLPHGGGQQISPGSDRHDDLIEWVDRVIAGTHCDADSDVALVPLASNELLTRASMDLRGKRPTLAELDAVGANPNTYATLVEQYLHSPEFLERVKDIYDDAFLVRREDNDDADRAETAALYAEALELIAYIVANNRPFSEIGTANYTVANEIFQQNTERMPFPMEPVTGTAWQPTHYLDGRVHAGVLSTSAFYEVWGTNNTNKNRGRANRWSIIFHCYNFLDTRDEDAVLNAVTARQDCVACHKTLDPIASFLFPYDNADGLESNDGNDFFQEDRLDRWRTANRRPPALYGVPGTDLRDLGRLLTENERFAQCQTNRAFEMLFLRAPETNDELTTANDIALRWKTEDNSNFRALVRRWLLSDVYRGRPADGGAAWIRRASPERLETLVQDLTGFLWTREADDPMLPPVPLLTSREAGFKIILGGIDGETVTKRSYSFNASVALVQRKVAALAAAYVVENDLTLPDGQRKLLNGVTGTEDPDLHDAALRTLVARIARRLYGQRFDINSDQIDVWVQLYGLLHDDRTQGGSEENEVPGTPGERAWRGLLTTMLRSPRLLLY
jgi:hypothetical protein